MRLLFLAVLLLNCSTSQKRSALVKGYFFGVKPTSTPQLLVPAFINTKHSEYNGTFSPSGNAFYYTTEFNHKGYITYTQMDSKGVWTTPRIAQFSGTYSDYDPMFSLDGSRMYFSSTRPPSNKNGSSIWYVERLKNKQWSEPQELNFTDKSEYYTSMTNKGTIYFNIWSTQNIYKALRKTDGYEVIEVDSSINGAYEKGDPFVSPNEDYMIFRAIKEDGLGRGDLYISYKIKGSWSEPINLGETINSSGQEMCPYVTSDGSTFIFASSRTEASFNFKPNTSLAHFYKQSESVLNGKMNIYFMSTNFIQDLRSSLTRKDE